MTNYEIAKKIITENFEDGCCGLFKSESLVGDERDVLFDNGEIRILICYDYTYFEVLGLSDKDFKRLLEYYEQLQKKMYAWEWSCMGKTWNSKWKQA